MTKPAECPDCGAQVPLAPDVMASEIVSCPDCGLELEVTNLEPLTLAPAPTEEEDWGE